jgi:hypothetical protein
MKILSFIGMIIGVALMGISIYNYASLKDLLSGVSAATVYYILIPGLIGFYFLIFSLLVAKNYKWGDKNSFVPPTM